jgi:hypothetical protein
MYVIQHCIICRPSDSTVSEDAGIEPETVAMPATADIQEEHHGQPTAAVTLGTAGV